MVQERKPIGEFIEYSLPQKWHKSELVAGALSLVERLERKGFVAYWAGGAVRDLLLGIAPKDIDIATSAPPEVIETIFRKTLAVGKEFGVMVVLLRGFSYEVATFRTDKEYRDFRRPSGVVFSEPKEDALRRDFSINGLFYDPLRSYIIDYVGGVTSLKEQKIQTIGDPYHRFREDNLRMLRAVRFATRFPFAIEESTWTALKELEINIVHVSQERIKEEFEKIFAVDEAQTAQRGLHLLHLSNLLYRIFPFLLSGKNTFRVVKSETGHKDINKFLSEQVEHFFLLVKQGFLQLAQRRLVFFIWAHIFNFFGKNENLDLQQLLAGLEQQTDFENLLTEMRFSNKEKNELIAMLQDKQRFYKYDSLSLGEQKRVLRDELFAIKVAFVSSLRQSLEKDSEYGSRLFAARAQYSEEELWPVPLLTGKDLIGMGLRPGPHFGDILYQLENKQLAGELSCTEEARVWLAKEYSHLQS